MIVWGSMFVVTKTAVREIPPLTLAALRFFIAAIVLVPLALLRGSLPKPIPWAPLTLMGLTGIALFTVAFNYALIYGSAMQGALIYALVPAAVSVAAVGFLKESLPRHRILGIALSFIGVAIVVLAGEPDRGSPRPLLGALCMLGVVVAWAAYTVVAKRLSDADPMIVIAFATILGMLMLLPFAALELSRAPWPHPSLRARLAILFLGIVASGIAFVAYGWVLRVLDASIVGVYTNLDPIVGVITAVVFLGEPVHAGQMLGGAIAIIGMALATWERSS